MKAKKTTSITVEFKIEAVRDLIIREILQKDGRFKDLFPTSSTYIQVTNNDTIFKVTITKDDYLK